MIYILIQLTQFKLIIFFTNNMTLYYFHFAFGFLLSFPNYSGILLLLN